jgi:hypothetical protein
MSARILFTCAGLALLGSEVRAQCEFQALSTRNPVYRDALGKSVSMDGTTIVAGAYAAETKRPGSAAVYELSGSSWIQTAQLRPSDGGSADQFGNSVGVSGDVIVVGSEFHDTAAGNNAGAVYVYEKILGKWLETAILEPHDAAQSRNFGEYVAISGDVIVVGDRFDKSHGNNSGAAYVFERDGNAWVETAKLIGSAARRNDLSADTVAIDGLRIVMSSYRSDVSGPHSGSAYVFEKQGGSWVETAHLAATDGAGELSRGVALDGDRIVLGARLDATAGTDAGAGYVFELVGGSWVQTAKLVPPEAAAGDWIGEAVAVSGDAILLSGHHHDTFGSSSGAGFLYRLRDGLWTPETTLYSSQISPGDEFSHAVAMSGDLAVLTSPYEGAALGAAYVFTLDQALCACDGSGGGSVTALGTELGGTNIGTLTALDEPVPGSPLRLQVSGIPNGTRGFVWMSTQTQTRSAFGGTMLVQLSGAVRVPFTLSGGEATVSWTVPYTMCGDTFRVQATALDDSQDSGRVFTNALEVVVNR